MAARCTLDRHVDAARRFNRFYTQRIGALHEGLLDSPFPLTEARVLYELGVRRETTASRLAQDLDIDSGYLSRILRGFGDRGLVDKARSPDDGRQSLLRLSPQGREAFAGIDARSRQEMGAMLGALQETDRERLSRAFATIEGVFGNRGDGRVPYVLRPPQPGDMGWIVHRHGALYAQDYGWDETFEGLVAGIVAEFVQTCDPKAERCWIAEMDGAVVGSVFVVRASNGVAKLRLLLVEPHVRGLGIGGRLIDECVRFACRVGYRKMTLWTQSMLVAARHLYEQAGFTLVDSAPHRSFGKDLVGETWDLPLTTG